MFNGHDGESLFAPGVTLADRPGTVEALETALQDAELLQLVDRSAARDRVGHGRWTRPTPGIVARNMEMYYDLNAVPDGARNLICIRRTAIRLAAPRPRLSAEFLRPFLGYRSIRVRGNSATGDYHALQVQVNRRYIHGVQFGAAYTLQRARGLCRRGSRQPVDSLNRPGSCVLQRAGAEQSAQSRRSTTRGIIPGGGRGVFNNLAGRHSLLDGWQLSGENDFVTGDWADVILTTSDNFDFTGGDGGNGGCLAGSDPCAHVVRPVVVGDPAAGGGNPLTGWFNTSAFQRPSGCGDYGNAPRNVVRKPGVDNWNLALFKNIPIGGQRSLQFRAEAYNVLNHTEFQDIDRTARFDPAGNQINPNFGTAIGIGTPTRPPRTIQMSGRFDF